MHCVSIIQETRNYRNRRLDELRSLDKRLHGEFKDSFNILLTSSLSNIEY